MNIEWPLYPCIVCKQTPAKSTHSNKLYKLCRLNIAQICPQQTNQAIKADRFLCHGASNYTLHTGKDDRVHQIIKNKNREVLERSIYFCV